MKNKYIIVTIIAFTRIFLVAVLVICSLDYTRDGRLYYSSFDSLRPALCYGANCFCNKCSTFNDFQGKVYCFSLCGSSELAFRHASLATLHSYCRLSLQSYWQWDNQQTWERWAHFDSTCQSVPSALTFAGCLIVIYQRPTTKPRPNDVCSTERHWSTITAYTELWPTTAYLGTVYVNRWPLFSS